MRIAFSVPGIPAAQPRPRAVMAHGGQGARIHEVTHVKGADGVRRPHPITAFKAAVQEAATRAYPLAPVTCPVALTVIMFFPRPANSTRKRGPNPRLPKVSKPDWDNLGKAVSDALNGILYRDDAQIAHAVVKKIVCTPEEQARTEVILETFTEWS